MIISTKKGIKIYNQFPLPTWNQVLIKVVLSPPSVQHDHCVQVSLWPCCLSNLSVPAGLFVGLWESVCTSGPMCIQPVKVHPGARKGKFLNTQTAKTTLIASLASGEAEHTAAGSIASHVPASIFWRRKECALQKPNPIKSIFVLLKALTMLNTIEPRNGVHYISSAGN